MRDIRNSLLDLRVWASLHVMIGIGVPVILLFFFGCKEITEEKAPIGVPVEAAVIEQELQKALEGTSVHNVKKNEQVVFELNQTLENGASSPYLYLKQHVIQLHDTPDYFAFTYNEITEDPNAEPGTKPKVVEKDSPLYIPRPTGSALSLQENGMYALQNLNLFSERRAETLSNERPVVNVTYHDLHVETEIQSAPPLVRQDANCRGVPDCQIRVTRIRFDQVNWYSTEDYDKLRYTLEISPDVPYLGRVISDCVSTQVPYEQRTVYIKECQVLLDFAYGE